MSDLLDLVYDAASGGTPFGEVGRALQASSGATTMAMWTTGRRGGEVAFLCALDVPSGADRAYADHYHRLDPWDAAFRRDALGVVSSEAPRIVLGPELVEERALVRSEFYADFARAAGLRHVVGSMLPTDASSVLNVALHRPEGAQPFDDEARRLLAWLLPHLARAVRLRRRLAEDEARAEAGLLALEALGTAVLVVDAEARVVLANAAARGLCGSHGAIRLVRSAGALRLSAAHREEAAALAALIRRVASQGHAGRSVRLQAPEEGLPPLAVLVMRLPGALAPPGAGGRPGHPVLLLARPLGPARTVRTDLLAELFGLSRAEAEVAATLARGGTPAGIAATRGVALPTVRTQLRGVLAKSGAASLRELQGMLAQLSELDTPTAP